MMKTVFSICKQIFSYLITFALIIILIFVLIQRKTGVLPNVMGYHLMYVLTASMSPELEAGDAVLVQKVEVNTLQQGDIICYQGTKGDTSGKLITHKIIVAPYEQNGIMWVQTKGTANQLPDDPIETSKIVGVVRLRLQLIGKLYRFFCTIPGLIITILPILLMIVLEVRRITVNVKNEKSLCTVKNLSKEDKL